MSTVKLDWQSPLALLESPSKLPEQPGVYVFSLLRAGCHFAHYTGSTSSIRRRVGEHISRYTKGKYWLHDLDETRHQDRLGRPLYSVNSLFDDFMRDLAARWVSELHVFRAVVTGNVATPEQVEGAVAWAFHRDPRRCFTRFYDFSHQITLNPALELVHSFQGPCIEGL